MCDSNITIPIIAIAVSAVFSAIGLFSGYLAQKRTNRINIAKRLSDLSAVLSEDLILISRIRTECLREIKTIEAQNQEIDNERLISLKKTVEDNGKSQEEIDDKQSFIDDAFNHLDDVKPEDIEIAMMNAYSWKLANEGALDLFLHIKSQR